MDSGSDVRADPPRPNEGLEEGCTSDRTTSRREVDDKPAGRDAAVEKGAGVGVRILMQAKSRGPTFNKTHVIADRKRPSADVTCRVTPSRTSLMLFGKGL